MEYISLYNSYETLERLFLLLNNSSKDYFKLEHRHNYKSSF